MDDDDASWLKRIPWGLITVVGSLLGISFAAGSRWGGVLQQQVATITDEEKTRQEIKEHEAATMSAIAELRGEVQGSREAMARQFGGEHAMILDRVEKLNNELIAEHVHGTDQDRRLDQLEGRRK